MNIYLDGTSKFVNKYLLFKKCGYKQHKNGFIKEDETGRFHLVERDKFIWDLHYDIYVGWKHVSIDMPFRCNDEKNKIKKMKFRIWGRANKKNKDIVLWEDYKDIVK